MEVVAWAMVWAGTCFAAYAASVALNRALNGGGTA